MAEIESLARCEMLLYSGPLRDDSGIAEQTHDDSATLASLLYGKEGFTGLPSVSHSLVISLARTLSDNHIETVVTKIKTLTGTLHSITYHCNRLVLKHLKGFAKRKFLTSDDGLFYTAKVKFCHNSDIMLILYLMILSFDEFDTCESTCRIPYPYLGVIHISRTLVRSLKSDSLLGIARLMLECNLKTRHTAFGVLVE